LYDGPGVNQQGFTIKITCDSAASAATSGSAATPQERYDAIVESVSFGSGSTVSVGSPVTIELTAKQDLMNAIALIDDGINRFQTKTLTMVDGNPRRWQTVGTEQWTPDTAQTYIVEIFVQPQGSTGKKESGEYTVTAN
jgi:hypothetical protein